MRYQPSKLVMRVRFPVARSISIAIIEFSYGNVRDWWGYHCSTQNAGSL